MAYPTAQPAAQPAMPAAAVNNTAAVNNGGPAKNFRPPRETSRGRSAAGEVRGPQGAPGAQQQRVNDRYNSLLAFRDL